MKDPCLSDSYVCYFLYEGIMYRSVRHFYHAQKCVHLKDFFIIMRALSRDELEEAALKIKVREDWGTVRKNILWKGMQAKFKDENMRWHLLKANVEEIPESIQKKMLLKLQTKIRKEENEKAEKTSGRRKAVLF